MCESVDVDEFIAVEQYAAETDKWIGTGRFEEPGESRDLFGGRMSAVGDLEREIDLCGGVLAGQFADTRGEMDRLLVDESTVVHCQGLQGRDRRPSFGARLFTDQGIECLHEGHAQ